MLSVVQLEKYAKLTNPLLHAATADPVFSEEIFEGYNNIELNESYQEASKQLTFLKLENEVFESFLEQNDPKLLERVKRQMENVRKAPRIHFASQISLRSSPPDEVNHFLRSRETDRSSINTIYDGTMSQKTMTTLSRPVGLSQRLDQISKPSVYIANRVSTAMRIEMAEKECNRVLAKCEWHESRTRAKMRLLNAEINMLVLRLEETQKATEIFEQYVRAQVAEQIFVKMPAEKFVKFFEDWIKNGSVLIGTMKLQISSITQQWRQQRALLDEKIGLKGVPKLVDFKVLETRKEESVKDLDMKNQKFLELKRITANAALNLNKQKKELVESEDQRKNLIEQTKRAMITNTRLERDMEVAQREVSDSRQDLQDLQENMKRFRAPSTMAYINLKHKLTVLEKEEKLLNRQIYILTIKLKNKRMNTHSRE